MSQQLSSSPFILSLQTTMRAAGVLVFPINRRRGIEFLSGSWMPAIKHGLPSLDWKTGKWDSYDHSVDPWNLMLNADQSGNFRVGSGDDDGVFLETQLQSGEELPEVLEFLCTANAELIGTSKVQTRTLRSLLDDVFLLITGGDKLRLLSLRPQTLLLSESSLMEPVEASLRNDFAWFADHSYLDFAEWIDRNGLRDAFSEAPPALDSDLLLEANGGLKTIGLLQQGSDTDFGLYPHLVLRPRADVSRMLLADFFERAQESSNLAELFFPNWKSLPGSLKEFGFEIPSLKRDQTAFSIELRSTRLIYQSKVQQLSAVREPFSQIIPLYRKRIRAIDAVHNELLDEIDSIQQPLPFFLEYPYRRFRKSDDSLTKLRSGQLLLNLLAKVPLYLVAEELCAAGVEVGMNIIEKVRRQPCSDGTLLEFRRQLVGDLEALPLPVRPRVFQQLTTSMKPTGEIESLVAARNRYHHPPFDEIGFLEALERTIPSMMEAIRKQLAGVAFCIPYGCKYKEGRRWVTASNVCCTEATFPRTTFEIFAEFEDFPVDTLVAYVTGTSLSVPIQTLFTFKQVTRESLDFGVFDHMRGEIPEFHFVRDI